MKKRLFIMDIDGTLALGNQLIDGAAELIEEIHRQHAICCYFTNNSSRGVAEYVDKFREWGIETTEEEFVTAGTFAITELKKRYGEQKIFVLGTKAFLWECRRMGLNVTEKETQNIVAVLTSYDREMNYEKIATVCRVLEKHDVPWYATNEDLCCPYEDGMMLPDCGAISYMISLAVNRKPQFLGKPHPEMAEYVLEKWNCTKEEALLVGDRCYTDIACGQRAGIDTCLVLTGEEKSARNKADICLNSVKDLMKILQRQRLNKEEFLMCNWIQNTDGAEEGISPDQIYAQESRWYRGDLHIHTTMSDGHDTPKEIKIRAEKEGLDFYAVTDHNVWQKKWPLTSCMVLPGMEITQEIGHANRIKAGNHEIFSLNHPFLDQWSWNYMDLQLSKLTCLEVDNNPTFEYDVNQHAEKANKKATALSDLLWADGHRICAVGGSDVHLKETERYGDAAVPPKPGDPSTWCYMEQMTPAQFLKSIQACHVYVTRNCEVQFSCECYQASGKKIPGTWQFGDKLPKECVIMGFELKMKTREKRPEVFYLNGGEKTVLMEEVQQDGWRQYNGTITLDYQKGYHWIRFGAENRKGNLLFYANPFTKGEKEPELLTFGDASSHLV
mgnify:CR=1 FL=1